MLDETPATLQFKPRTSASRVAESRLDKFVALERNRIAHSRLGMLKRSLNAVIQDIGDNAQGEENPMFAQRLELCAQHCRDFNEALEVVGLISPEANAFWKERTSDGQTFLTSYEGPQCYAFTAPVGEYARLLRADNDWLNKHFPEQQSLDYLGDVFERMAQLSVYYNTSVQDITAKPQR